MEPWSYMPWYGMIFGPIMMIAVLAAIVAVIVLVIRWVGGGAPGQPPQGYGQPRKSALDILKDRFAKGEIDKAEFEERRRVLGE